MNKEYITLNNLSKLQSDIVSKFNKNIYKNYNFNNCELCGSSHHKIIFKNDRYGIKINTVYCLSCGFLFSNPRMSNSFLKKFYNSDLYRLLYEEYGLENNNEILYKQTIRELKSYSPRKPIRPNFNKYYDKLYFDFINHNISDYKTVLDIGTGKGKKLLDFNFIKKETYGIEPSEIYAKALYDYGLKVKKGFLDDVSKKFDLVMLSHVLEHLTDINNVIKKINLITNKYLYIEVPGHVKKLQSIQNAHCFYFSINTLKYFFLNNKFNLIKIEYCKDNEFILALFEKSNKKKEFNFNYEEEKSLIKKIHKNYLLKYPILKMIKLTKSEKLIKNIRKRIK